MLPYHAHSGTKFNWGLCKDEFASVQNKNTEIQATLLSQCSDLVESTRQIRRGRETCSNWSDYGGVADTCT